MFDKEIHHKITKVLGELLLEALSSDEKRGIEILTTIEYSCVSALSFVPEFFKTMPEEVFAEHIKDAILNCIKTNKKDKKTMNEPTHFVLIRTITGIETYIGVSQIGDYWVDDVGNKYNKETGKRIDSDFSVIDLKTIQKYD